MATLNTRKRDDLPERSFAFPKQRKEPLEDASHVRNAIARFHQVTGNRRLMPVLPLASFVREAARHETSRSAGDGALAKATPARVLDLGAAVRLVGASDLEAALLATAV